MQRKPDRSAVVLIPAYRPDASLISVVEALLNSDATLVIVDDGSGPEYRHIFEQLSGRSEVIVLRHAVNLGKGAALKTGLNFILCEWPECLGMVTVDADGQHHPEDIARMLDVIAANPDSLVLGVRNFNREVPFRSRLGNNFTRRFMRILVGQNLSDTQTGLRAIPRALARQLLKIPASGYEFELEMLLAAKHLGTPIHQHPIRTIYEPGNPSSHFQPLRDSMRIYFVLLRFSFVALLTAALDNLLFYSIFHLTGSVVRAQVAARIAAGFFNYSAVRRAAFLSDERHQVVLPRYLMLVAANAVLSYAGIRFFSSVLPIGVFPAKLLAETLLFIANFAIQRDFVFTRRNPLSAATNWDQYYKAVPATAHITRKYTQGMLHHVLHRYAGAEREVKTIVEIGGANSCFLNGILESVRPGVYHVVDQNQYGLELLRDRVRDREDVVLHRGDVLAMSELALHADAVFSVGLVEHFDREGTRKAVRAHFDLLRPGGCAIITFPTPTWLYRIARAFCEICGLWKFPDERPLRREEVLDAVRDLGDVMFEKTLWPLVLTQHLIVVKKG